MVQKQEANLFCAAWFYSCWNISSFNLCWKSQISLKVHGSKYIPEMQTAWLDHFLNVQESSSSCFYSIPFWQKVLLLGCTQVWATSGLFLYYIFSLWLKNNMEGSQILFQPILLKALSHWIHNSGWLCQCGSLADPWKICIKTCIYVL